ncbi:MAG: hypothetical protein AAGJ82_14845 [Bacteroidota bacterium]
MQKQVHLLFFLLIFTFSCQSDAPKQEAKDADTTPEARANPSFTITPGEGIGLLTAELNRTDIEALIGKDNVQATEFQLGEGETAPGLKLYPDQPTEVTVLLDEEGFPILYRIERADSPWITPNGLKIGSTLAEVTAANGGTFQLTGFDWDYGGTVVNWQSGQLDGKDFGVVFGYAPDVTLSSTTDSAIIGDQVINSNHPNLKKYDIRVVTITQTL